MFEQKPLLYSYESLEPHIDAKTMEIHYSKHHAGYVKKLNAAVEATEFAEMSLNELFENREKIPKDKLKPILNNAGGHFNHSFFWNILSPESEKNPSGELAQKINEKFGDFEEFKKQFTEEASKFFGSGWTWLVLNENKELKIISLPNQEVPMNYNYSPLLGIDLWEHAYYLKYQNRRPEYIEAFWNVVNWKKVEELFSQAKE